MNEFLEYPRRLYQRGSIDQTPIVFFETGERVRGFSFTNDNGAAVDVLFSTAVGASLNYFVHTCPANSSGFVPVQWFAFAGLAVSAVANDIDVTVFVATPATPGEIVEP